MNKPNMNEALQIVNNRVMNMLDLKDVNSEVFFRDIRTLSELIQIKLEDNDLEGF
jgi:hypothetical protein